MPCGKYFALAPDISTCLADARTLELLTADSDRLDFSHEIIQRYFSHIASEGHPDVHRAPYSTTSTRNGP
jgi:hypothetical protein